MLLNSKVSIHAPKEKAWDFLTDSSQIGQVGWG